MLPSKVSSTFVALLPGFEYIYSYHPFKKLEALIKSRNTKQRLFIHLVQFNTKFLSVYHHPDKNNFNVLLSDPQDWLIQTLQK